MTAVERPALLALEDGTVLSGTAFGAESTVTGEVCFNTGMTGYQEILTDPSYHGQIVTMTAPEIGNTGTNDDDDQSDHPWVAGLVVRDAIDVPSSWRATSTLDAYLRRHGVPAVGDIDTRRLTRHIRTAGAMRGALSTESHSGDDLVDVARAAPSLIGRDLAREVTTERPYAWTLDDLNRRARSSYAAGAEHSVATGALMDAYGGPRRKVAAFDFGLKRNILDLLVASGCDVTVMPATTEAQAIVAGNFDGVFLSNGPGDPEPVTYAIETVRTLLGRVPIFGICLGHQILALALGATTYKLPFGHRGSNHPVTRTDNPRIEVTCQNHGFAVDAASLERTPARLSHVNLNDGTVEGIALDGVAYSVQYHPESGPGPHDSRYLFEQFQILMQSFRPMGSSLEVNV
jgi:carbamoyl-phosphate synthase small subunit